MNFNNEKCVIVVDESRPIGIIANAAAILGVSIGMKKPYVVGNDVFDSCGNHHMGIIQFPIPVLKSSKDVLKNIRNESESLKNTDYYSDLIVADFSTLAQGCKTYDEYVLQMADCNKDNLEYIGVALCGNKKIINKLTGNLPLLK